MKKIVFLLLLFTLSGSNSAFAGFSTVYSQDFNTLALTGDSNSWLDNVILNRWYSNRSTYRADDGNSVTGGLMSYGSTGMSDRALGSMPTNLVGPVYYGFQITNITEGTVPEIMVSYTGEQWRNSNTVSHRLAFQYQITSIPSTIMPSAGWIDVPALDFQSPTYGGASGPLDGNLPANRTLLSATLINLDLKSGYDVWFRWYDANDTGSDHGLAIDDFSLKFADPTPVPIPAAIWLFASGVIGLIGLRRFRK